MPTPTTTASTRRLSEVARHVVIPSDIVTTGWPSVEAKCREFGDEFDEWQRGAGRLILGKRDDGIYAATIGGVTLSIPRQVAKTFLVGRIVFVLCVLFPGLRVIWTAHRTRTATNTFKALQGYAKRPRVAPNIAEIRRTNGEQEIVFTNGSIIMFGAREAGFGRGFDEIDVEVFDEAQILTAKALEDMVAATNQSRHPHGALLFFMGTPPRPVDPGEAFTMRRDDALSGESDDAVYIECSADQDADPDDRKQWAVANPSFPLRTPLRSMLRLRKNLTSDDSWRREALGIWDSDDQRSDIDQAVWAELEHKELIRPSPVAFAIEISEDRQWTSIGLAGVRSDGLVHVQVVESIRGTGTVPDRVAELVKKWNPVAVALHPGGPAGSLIPGLEQAKVEVTSLWAREIAAADAGFLDAVSERTIRHLSQPVLNIATRAARKQPRGEGFVLRSMEPGTDIAPLKAVTLAAFALAKASSKKKRTGVVV